MGNCCTSDDPLTHSLKDLLLITFSEVHNLPSSWKPGAPISTWSGITVAPRSAAIADDDDDDDGEEGREVVEAIDVVGFDLAGELGGSLKRVEFPKSTKRIFLGSNPRLTGELDVARLLRRVPGLIIFNASQCDFRSLQMPQHVSAATAATTLVELKLNDNAVSGAFDATVMLLNCSALKVLWLHDNLFTGEFDFISLPQCIVDVCIRRNTFTGHAALSNLPVSLKKLDISRNFFFSLTPHDKMRHHPADFRTDDAAAPADEESALVRFTMGTLANVTGGADVRCAFPRRSLGELMRVPAVHYFAHEGAPQLLRRVLEMREQPLSAVSDGDDTKKSKNDPWSALHHAVHAGSLECCRVLLDANAFPCYTGDGVGTPLALAASTGNVEIVRLLLEHPATRETHERFKNMAYKGKTALDFAGDNEEVCSMLSAAGIFSAKDPRFLLLGGR